MTREEVLAALTARGAEGDDHPLDLADTALLIAALDHPDQSLDFYRAHLQALRNAVNHEIASATGLAAKCEALALALAGHYGYRGDSANYDDPANADLIRVIDRRRGLPVALGILWIDAGRAAGLSVEGLNFPGHFLIRAREGAEAVILDPFHNGGQVTVPEMRAMLRRLAGEDRLSAEHHRAVGDREILLRLLNNIKGRAMRIEDWPRAEEILIRMLALAPLHRPCWREIGLVQAERGHVRHAIVAFEKLAELATGPDEQFEAATLLAKVRAKLN